MTSLVYLLRDVYPGVLIIETTEHWQNRGYYSPRDLRTLLNRLVYIISKLNIRSQIQISSTIAKTNLDVKQEMIGNRKMTKSKEKQNKKQRTIASNQTPYPGLVN